MNDKIPLDMLFSSISNAVITFFITTALPVNTYLVESKHTAVRSQHLSLIYSLDHLGHSLVELHSYLASSCHNILNYTWLSMHKDIRLVNYVKLPSKHAVVYTTNTLSATWLQREVSEFSNIRFLHSHDTRRLLTDYLRDKANPRTLDFNVDSFNVDVGDYLINKWLNILPSAEHVLLIRADIPEIAKLLGLFFTLLFILTY